MALRAAHLHEMIHLKMILQFAVYLVTHGDHGISGCDKIEQKAKNVVNTGFSVAKATLESQMSVSLRSSFATIKPFGLYLRIFSQLILTTGN